MTDKRKKFIRLAEIRVNNCVKYLRLTGNLSNRHNYEYNSEDYNKIIKVLENEIKVWEIKD